MADRQVDGPFQSREGIAQECDTAPKPAAVSLRMTERYPALMALGQHPMFAALPRDQRQRLVHSGRIEQLVAG